jgi:hypothetical protein
VEIAGYQRYIPLNVDAEAYIFVASQGEISCKEDSQVDILLLRDAPQQRCLVLNRVAYKVGEPDLSSCG